jgi:hypothetical protein
MAGYPGLTKIEDATTRDVCKKLYDLVGALTTRITTLEAAALTKSTSIDAGGLRLTSLADPAGEQDAVTVHHLRAYVEAQAKVL